MRLSQQLRSISWIPLLLMLLGSSLGSGLIFLSQKSVTDSVNDYVIRESYLKDLYNNLGYGGGIHAFKNYVLRQEDAYRQAALVKLNAASAATQAYWNLENVTEEERQHLAIVQSTIGLYLERLQLAERLISLDQDSSVIDAQVRVDDDPAIAALNAIDLSLQETNLGIVQRLTRSSWLSITIILSAAVAVVFLSLLLNRLLARRLVDAMATIVDTSEQMARGYFSSKKDSPDSETTATPELGNDELNQLYQYLQDLGARLQSQVLELRQHSHRDRELSTLAFLLTDNTSSADAARAVLKHLTTHMSMNAGRLSLRDSDGWQETISWGLLAGSDRQTSSQYQALLDDLMEENRWTEFHPVPEHFWKISTPFGETFPETLIFVPIRYQDKGLGIIELAGLRRLNDEDKGLLDSLSEILGTGFNSLCTQEINQKLLTESQTQARTLEVQQRELEEANQQLEVQARDLEVQSSTLDMTNRELLTIKNDLEAQAEQLETASRHKSEFLASMSHEFRTPLNSLMVLSTLLQESSHDNLTDKQRAYLQSIQQAGEDLQVLIEDVLDLTKIEAGKVQLLLDTFTLGDLFHEIDQIFAPIFQQSDVEWIVDLPEALAALSLHTDKNRLKQILRNLLANAHKFTQRGTVTLSASSVSTRQLSISVQDTGIGIAQDKQGRIFDAFEQADTSINREYGGTGLGLTISRQLATMLGGNIVLQSSLGGGSRFTLNLPQTLPASMDSRVANSVTHKAPRITNNAGFAAADEPIPQPATDSSNSANRQISTLADQLLETLDPEQPSVLIVEDDKSFATILAEQVKQRGLQAIVVNDGQLAMELVNRYPPNAAILDVKLPSVSGMAILDRLKSQPTTRHIPVHMVSAIDYHENAQKIGAIGYLNKPVTIDKISASLDKLFELMTSQERQLLILEDNPEHQQQLATLVAQDQTHLLLCSDASEALQLVQEKPIDAIIVTLNFPDVTALRFLEQLNQLESNVPPIILYSDRPLDEQEEQTILQQSDRLVLKGARSREQLLDEVTLFLHRSVQSEPGNAIPMHAIEPQFAGHKVLLVDDDIRNVFALTSALENRELDVITARNGQEALEILHNHPDIELILTDIMMPKMDGLELIDRIRDAQESFSDIPIIALTAKAGKTDHEQIIAAGANDYLSKPVNLPALMSVIHVWLPETGLNL